MSPKIPVHVERLNGGEPIVAPRGEGWDSLGTGNATGIYLARTPDNEPLFGKLLGKGGWGDRRTADGVVAVIYTGYGTGGPYSSACGLAIFTPRFELLKRFPEPVLHPSGDPNDVDGAAMGDASVSRIGDTFYMLYSSWNGSRAYACLAHSSDLITWERQGKMPGNINVYQNKDHALFEQQVDGWHYCLHRPWNFPFEQKDYAIRLARSRSPLGPWKDCGTILRAFQHSRGVISWVGGGSVPLPLGGKRFLMLYHKGMIFEDGWRQYDACAAILDFDRFSMNRPEDLVQARLESFFIPETPAEKNPNPRLRIDIVFPCSAHVFGEDIYIVYGAGDVYGCAARVNKNALVQAVESSGLENPEKDLLHNFY